MRPMQVVPHAPELVGAKSNVYPFNHLKPRQFEPVGSWIVKDNVENVDCNDLPR